jgi:hypothetical protein
MKKSHKSFKNVGGSCNPGKVMKGVGKISNHNVSPPNACDYSSFSNVGGKPKTSNG